MNKHGVDFLVVVVVVPDVMTDFHFSHPKGVFGWYTSYTQCVYILYRGMFIDTLWCVYIVSGFVFKKK